MIISVEGGRHLGFGLGVDLAEHRARVLLGCLLKDRAEHLARAAPVGPEVDQDQATARHRRIEVLGRQLDGSHRVSLALANTGSSTDKKPPPNIPASP
jgi:hypothetical protein